MIHYTVCSLTKSTLFLILCLGRGNQTPLSLFPSISFCLSVRTRQKIMMTNKSPIVETLASLPSLSLLPTFFCFSSLTYSLLLFSISCCSFSFVLSFHPDSKCTFFCHWDGSKCCGPDPVVPFRSSSTSSCVRLLKMDCCVNYWIRVSTVKRRRKLLNTLYSRLNDVLAMLCISQKCYSHRTKRALFPALFTILLVLVTKTRGKDYWL